jgi:hypothetical protein
MTEPTSSERLVNSAVLTMVARFAMIGAAAALPIIGTALGWALQRGVNSVDEIGKKVDSIKDQSAETGMDVKLIKQIQQMQGASLADHEARVRILERLPPKN